MENARDPVKGATTIKPFSCRGKPRRLLVVVVPTNTIERAPPIVPQAHRKKNANFLQVAGGPRGAKGMPHDRTASEWRMKPLWSLIVSCVFRATPNVVDFMPSSLVFVFSFLDFLRFNGSL